MHIYTSHDYATAFIQRQPEALPVIPPYDIDSPARLRLLNGSVMRYSVGLAWHVAGLSESDLPPHPGWDWGLYYDQNVATGHRPSEPLLTAGRVVAALYLCASIAALFGIGWMFGGAPVAYISSGLYALNPIILLNGRRALVESALLCFGLLLMWTAFQIARKRGQGERVGWGWWLGLTVTAALTLASKYSGIIFVAAAFGGLGLVELWRLFARRHDIPLPLRAFGVHVLALSASGLLALVLLVAISPALWNDPLARARDLAAMLQEQVEIVVSIQPDAPTTLPQRIEGILTQPFMQPPQFFEQASWAEAAPISAEIQRYLASPLSGLQFGLLLGVPLTLLAGFGLVILFWQRLRPLVSWSMALILLIWLGVTVANLLINPLPWQRYTLPLIPIASLLASIGLLAAVTLLRRA